MADTELNEKANEDFYLAAILMEKSLVKLYGLNEKQRQEIHEALSYMMKGISSYADSLKRGLWTIEN